MQTCAVTSDSPGAACRPIPADWIRPGFARTQLRRILRLPDGWKLHSVRVTRVYPSRPAGIGMQFTLFLQHVDGRKLSGDIYLSPQRKPRGNSLNELHIDMDGPFRLRGLSIPLDGHPAAIHTPDQDEKLHVLAREALVDQRCPVWNEIQTRVFGNSVKALQATLLNYRPGRRCTLALRRRNVSHATPFVVGKILRGDSAHRAAGVHAAVAVRLAEADGQIITPHLHGLLPEVGMLVFEGIQSRDAETKVPAAAAGRVLSYLQSLPITGLPRFTPADELAATSRWVNIAGALGLQMPDLPELWHGVNALAAGLPEAAPVFTHRDFYASQLLRTDRGWAVIDLDTACAGDLEQDLGNYAGHLIWDYICAGRSAMEVDAGVHALIAAYETQTASSRSATRSMLRPIEVLRFHFYLISALLRVGLIHGLRTGFQVAARRLHKEALTWLGRAAKTN